jgi:hypothetical protein
MKRLKLLLMVISALLMSLGVTGASTISDVAIFGAPYFPAELDLSKLASMDWSGGDTVSLPDGTDVVALQIPGALPGDQIEVVDWYGNPPSVIIVPTSSDDSYLITGSNGIRRITLVPPAGHSSMISSVASGRLIIPVANAGSNQTVPLNREVVLNGSGSYDPQGHSLSYSWSYQNAPDLNNTPSLSDPASVAPTFVPDLEGDYVLLLVVFTEFWQSPPATVTITARPLQPPVAEAGSDKPVHAGKPVVLTGSGSSPDGRSIIAYQWNWFSWPYGSNVYLSEPEAVPNPTVFPDLPGDYVLQLIVTDSLGLVSAPDSVTISTSNSKPIAKAGPDQAIKVIGVTVQLDGSQSYDPDGDSISYRWTFVSQPPGSASRLIGANSASPSFVADQHGDYTVQLVVSDPWLDSTPCNVAVTFNNVKPVADAESSKSGVVDDPVTLDGTGSSDANGDTLTYLWSLASVPPGSTAQIADPGLAVTNFTPDLPGTYVAQLIVNDGIEDSSPSTTKIQVVSEKTATIIAIHQLQTEIASLRPSAFKSVAMRKLLNLELNLVIASLEVGMPRISLSLLKYEILPITDGCAARGVPDRNDWIVDCAAQRVVYPELLEIIGMIKEML